MHSWLVRCGGRDVRASMWRARDDAPMSGVVTRATVALVALLGVACSGGGDALDASHDARVLDCDGPIEAELVPAPSGPNAGVPIAAIAWRGDHCVLEGDENAPDALLVVADTAGTWFDYGVVAVRAGGWVITRSSTSESPTTYTTVQRDTDVFFELESAGARVRIDLRVSGTTLTLIAMHELR